MKKTRIKTNIPRGLDIAIVENILWFNKFTPLEKIDIFEKNRERVKRFRGLALKCIKDTCSKQ